MGALPVFARQLITVGGFAVAIAAPIGVVVAATPASPPAYLAQCNGGEEPDTFTTTCVPFMTPNTPVLPPWPPVPQHVPPGSAVQNGAPGPGTDATNPQAGEAERGRGNRTDRPGCCGGRRRFGRVTCPPSTIGETDTRGLSDRRPTRQLLHRTELTAGISTASGASMCSPGQSGLQRRWCGRGRARTPHRRALPRVIRRASFGSRPR